MGSAHLSLCLSAHQSSETERRLVLRRGRRVRNWVCAAMIERPSSPGEKWTWVGSLMRSRTKPGATYHSVDASGYHIACIGSGRAAAIRPCIGSISYLWPS